MRGFNCFRKGRLVNANVMKLLLARRSSLGDTVTPPPSLEDLTRQTCEYAYEELAEFTQPVETSSFQYSNCL